MVDFAHESEAQFAQLLDGYGIRWAYEPTTFVLDRNGEGMPLEAFTPDFYLPDFDTYVELTTMRQALVTKKNRKARRLAETHPEVRLKLLYRKDLERLEAKYRLADAA